MRLARLLTLVLCFFLDVHVRAEEAIVAAQGKKTIAQEGLKIVLDQGGLLEPRGTDFHLVRGSMFVEVEARTHLSTPFAKVWCEGQCRAIFERSSDHLIVKSLGGPWRLTRTGDPQTYRVPEAMQMRLAEVESDGSAAMEFPQSLAWQPLLKTWAHLFPGSAEEFKEQVLAFRPLWKDAVETASLLHEQGAARTLASHNAELERQAVAKRAEERENAQLRRQFRERNYLNP